MEWWGEGPKTNADVICELSLVVLAEHGELSAERGGVVVGALVRLPARLRHDVRVDPSPKSM